LYKKTQTTYLQQTGPYAWPYVLEKATTEPGKPISLQNERISFLIAVY